MGQWKRIKLGDVIIDLIGGGTPSTKEENYWNGNIPWMTSAHITSKEIFTGQRKISETGLKESATKLIPKNSLLIASRVGIGKAAINRIDVAISQDLTGVILDNSRIQPEYVYWWLALNQNKLKSLAQGSTIKGILKEDFAKLELELPSLNIQKEISNILNLVDEAIQKADEAIEHTERLKQGLMQKLLTEGIGHTEFKETKIGRIPKEWEVMELHNSILEMKNGFASGKRDIAGVVQIRMNNVSTEGRINFDKYLKVPKITNYKQYILVEDDFIFNNTNSIDLVGKSSVFKSAPFECVFSNHFTRIRFNKEIILPQYVLYHFILLWKTKHFQSLAIRHVGQAAVNSNYLLKMLLPFPSIKEQRKIVDIIQNVENRVLFEKRRKNQFEQIKQGLMNDLLTGKKRVTLN
ncbi:MAG: restriction endonuclease subunit S [Ignavibacteriaceae bacterium]|jgi:type I restriction enzyme S subunit|nr:restriction endonuclease subunit S [Ignavibacteriaceae bacterium]